MWDTNKKEFAAIINRNDSSGDRVASQGGGRGAFSVILSHMQCVGEELGAPTVGRCYRRLLELRAWMRFQGSVWREKGWRWVSENRTMEKACAPGQEQDKDKEGGEGEQDHLGPLHPRVESAGTVGWSAVRSTCYKGPVVSVRHAGQAQPVTLHCRGAALCVFAQCLLLLCLDWCWVFK